MPKQYSAPPPMTIDTNKTYQATLHTTMGDIKIDFFPKEAPKTVNSFVFLARDGFYTNVKFHRIIKGFMVQTGDPLGKNYTIFGQVADKDSLDALDKIATSPVRPDPRSGEQSVPTQDIRITSVDITEK